jgi:hypothetical protein
VARMIIWLQPHVVDKLSYLRWPRRKLFRRYAQAGGGGAMKASLHRRQKDACAASDREAADPLPAAAVLKGALVARRSRAPGTRSVSPSSTGGAIGGH